MNWFGRFTLANFSPLFPTTHSRTSIYTHHSHLRRLLLLQCSFSTSKKIDIPRERLTFTFSRSGGAGGQNVNKVNTKVELRFLLRDADWIPMHTRERLIELNPSMVTSAGYFMLTSTKHRTQTENIKDAVEKLEDLLAKASEVPKERIATSPPESSNEYRLKEKKHRSDVKKQRNYRGDD